MSWCVIGFTTKNAWEEQSGCETFQYISLSMSIIVICSAKVIQYLQVMSCTSTSIFVLSVEHVTIFIIALISLQVH